MNVTSKERVVSAINKEEVDRVPIGPPFQGCWALAAEGVSVKDSIKTPMLAAKAQINIAQSCDFDLLETMWDWLSPAEMLGCKVKIPEQGSISTCSHIINGPEDLDNITVVNPMKDYRFKASMETTKILTRDLGEEKFLIQTMVLPFTLAGELRGVEALMIDTFTEPDFVHELLRKTTDIVKEYVKVAVDSDADGVILCDPTASGSLISKEYFAEFSKPYIKECGKIVQDAGKYLLLHICGDTSDRLNDVVDIGADIFSIDHQVDIGRAIEQIGSRQTMLGNVEPANPLYAGTPDEVRRSSIDCINKAGKESFILGAGCDIVPGTPLENVQVWRDVVKL